MLKEIIRKINKNYNCELSIEELKILYEIDNISDESLDKYREKRNNYLDFCKLFSSSCVAKSPQEIDINTIAYIGNLYIDDKFLPTYNLRYLYGHLICYSKQIRNLENLEIVYNNIFDIGIKFDSLEKYEGLDNLKIVPRLYFESLFEENDLSTIEYVKHLTINNNFDVFNIKWPQRIDSLNFPSLCSISSNIKLPDNLKNLYLNNLKEIDGLKLPDNLELLSLNQIKSFNNIILPSNLRALYVSSLDVLKDLTIYDDLRIFADGKLVHSDFLYFNCNVIKRDKTKTLNRYSLY